MRIGIVFGMPSTTFLTSAALITMPVGLFGLHR